MKIEEAGMGKVRVASGKIIKQSLLAVVFICLVAACNGTTDTEVTWGTARPLHEIYKNDFPIGNIIRNTGDFSNATRSGILKRHYTIVTAENDMKPSNLAPAQDPGSVSDEWVYRFATADAIVANALDAGFQVHGHTLIWHTSQSPAWLAAGGEAYLAKFVTDVVTHFKGKVISWDVVNEAFRDGLTPGSNWKSCLRTDAPWYKSIGQDYIEMAFRAARAADPDVKLYYNDYNLNSPAKAQAVHNMVKEINDKWRNGGNSGLLIDGVGMQSHHNIATAPQSVETSIKLFASLGVEVGITELDIIANNGGSVNDSRLGSEWNDSVAQKQAGQYAAMFKIFKDNAEHISRVTFWGIDDGTSWRGVNHVTLMNSDYTLKPAFHAVMNPDQW